MKKLQVIKIEDLKVQGHTWIANQFGYILNKPNDKAKQMLDTHEWFVPTDEEILQDYIKTNYLPWKVRCYVPNYDNFQSLQGYTYFANQLEKGLLPYGIDFTPRFDDNVDLVLIINSVWVSANTEQIKSIKEKANGKSVAMFTMFESDHWIDTHVKEMENLDFLIVPCEWNKRILIKQGYAKPIFVCPLPINESFSLMDRPERREKFTFLHYNGGDYRKGFPEYLEAFYNEFKEDEPVKFVIKTREDESNNSNLENYILDNPNNPIRKATELHHISENINSGRDLVWIKKNINVSQLEILHQESDCFVFPSKGEGWGYPPLEAIMTGNPVIAPKKHAFLDWFNPACLEVKTTKEPATFSILGEKQEGTGNWYKPDITSLQDMMRLIYEGWKEEGRQYKYFKYAKQESQNIKEYYSQKVVAKLFIDILIKNKIIER